MRELKYSWVDTIALILKIVEWANEYVHTALGVILSTRNVLVKKYMYYWNCFFEENVLEF